MTEYEPNSSSGDHGQRDEADEWWWNRSDEWWGAHDGSTWQPSYGWSNRSSWSTAWYPSDWRSDQWWNSSSGWDDWAPSRRGSSNYSPYPAWSGGSDWDQSVSQQAEDTRRVDSGSSGNPPEEAESDVGGRQSSDARSSATDRKRVTGKEVVPSYDGEGALREYRRRVDLFMATTGIDEEYRGGRLMEKLEGKAWLATQTIDVKRLKSAKGVEYLLDHLQQELSWPITFALGTK